MQPKITNDEYLAVSSKDNTLPACYASWDLLLFFYQSLLRTERQAGHLEVGREEDHSVMLQKFNRTTKIIIMTNHQTSSYFRLCFNNTNTNK